MINKRFYLLTEIFRQPAKIEKFNRLPTKLLNFNRQPTSGPPPFRPSYSVLVTIDLTGANIITYNIIFCIKKG